MSEETGAEAPAEPVVEEVAAPEVEKEQETQEEKVYRQSEVDKIAAKVRANTAHRVRKETEAEIYKQFATQQPEAPRQEAVRQDAEPSRESFDSYEDYSRALARYEARQEFSRLEGEKQKQGAEQARAQEAQTQATRYNESVATVRAETPDFDDVVSSADIPVTPAIRDAILDSDNPARLQYHLAKNPEEVDRISKLSPVQQVKAIGVIEANLQAPARTTKAPAPVRPIGASGAGAAKDFSRMTMAEVKAAMRANGEL